VLPEDADTVIRYEDLEIHGDKALIKVDRIERGQNIHRRGADAKSGSVLLEPGIMISPAEVALLAAVGKADVKVMTLPKTAVISSGDELVDVTAEPEPHQIRKSNVYALEAAMQKLYWSSHSYHLPDRKDFLVDSLRVIAADHEVLILSGGVSKGKFDFIPEALEEIGVKKLFHQVSQRPGKPFWFGVSSAKKIVFALPGNPVSTYLCFYRYIKPWLMRSLGVSTFPVQAILAKDFSFQPSLTHFLQVSIRNEGGKLMAYPEAGGGSGDFANLKKVDGFLELPPERVQFEAGESFPYISFRAL
jgi:molybdopterin molybdotransferase